jgi:hypothetical protein
VAVHINPRLPAAVSEQEQPVESEQTDAQPAMSTEPAMPTEPDASTERRCLGFVVLADNFRRVRELADDCYERPRADLPPATHAPDRERTATLGMFVRADTAKLRRVLVCGFRNGTVSMVESLIQAEPHTQILIMVRNEAGRAAAWDDFDAHTKLVERKLLRGHHGRFEADAEQWTLTWCGLDGCKIGSTPHIRIVIGDWGSSRQLTALPAGFGHVASMDAVVLISNEAQGADARTAKTLMKLETLTKAPRVVAEVLDVELARRLRRRSSEHGSDRVSVYSIQELRAFFMFQSVVVPAFDPVYTELMGPWGESLMRLRPEAVLQGRCSFEQLAQHLARDHRALVAVELCSESHEHGGQSGCRTDVHVAGPGSPDSDTGIDLSRLVSVWVISHD